MYVRTSLSFASHAYYMLQKRKSNQLLLHLSVCVFIHNVYIFLSYPKNVLEVPYLDKANLEHICELTN